MENTYRIRKNANISVVPKWNPNDYPGTSTNFQSNGSNSYYEYLFEGSLEECQVEKIRLSEVLQQGRIVSVWGFIS